MLYLSNHLSATVVFTCCAVALMLYWSSIRLFSFSSVSSITSFQPSTRSRYLSSDWLRSLIDMRWFCMSRISRLLADFSMVWVWETWSMTWKVTGIKSWSSEMNGVLSSTLFSLVIVNCYCYCYYKMLKCCQLLIEQNKHCHRTCSCPSIILWMSSNSLFSLLISSLYSVTSRQPVQFDVELRSVGERQEHKTFKRWMKVHKVRYDKASGNHMCVLWENLHHTESFLLHRMSCMTLKHLAVLTK